MTTSRSPQSAPTARREQLIRQIRFLVFFTMAYNLIEAAVALAAGADADSSALLGFGLDSLVEVSSALAVAWQFAARDHGVHEARERIALRIISGSFFALASFIAYHCVMGLFSGRAAEHSGIGITLAALSLLIMPVVSGLQRHAGKQLGSNSAVADSKQTLLCTYMSAVLLIGLLANSLLGWWWADPVVGLAIAALAVGEGIKAWHGDTCCAPTGALLGPDERLGRGSYDLALDTSAPCCTDAADRPDAGAHLKHRGNVADRPNTGHPRRCGACGDDPGRAVQQSSSFNLRGCSGQPGPRCR